MRCTCRCVGWVLAALLAIVPAFVPTMLAHAEPPSEEGDAKLNESLRRELLAMRDLDQQARQEVLKNTKPGALATDDEALKKMVEIDRIHTTRMKEIVAEQGWPGRSLVGEDGAAAAWLLVQHADLDVDFQERSLPLVEAAVKAGEAKPSHWAYLVDRVRVNRKQPQVYGTQFIDRGQGLMPQPIEDEEHVDDRRKSVGLGTLAEYAETMRAVSTDSAGSRAE
jgi:hypothetical protein